ncbi:hypothetical protein ACHAQA_004546 [Verticillium albo-atrum]
MVNNFQRLSVLVAALLPVGLAAPVQNEEREADGFGVVGSTVKGSYIITLKSDLEARDVESHLDWLNEVQARALNKREFPGVKKHYDIGSYHAYAGKFDEETLEAIKNSPEVADVEEDQLWTLYALTTQTGAPHGLGSISSRTVGSTRYVYDDTAGQGGFAYIVDSGVLTTHAQFGGRASLGSNPAGGSHVDTSGHGTHVAGTVAGSTYGVAKRASIISVKVFVGNTASTSVILSGYNWAVNDIRTRSRTATSVINLSLGGPFSSSFNNAVNAASSAGVTSVIAAGNENQAVANVSPASAASAIAVGAVDASWNIASYSNWGPGVAIFAAGSNVLSSWIGSNTATRSISGTSMASPHVAGLVLYLQRLEGVSTPAAIKARIIALATTGRIGGNLRGSPNRLAYNGNGSQ